MNDPENEYSFAQTINDENETPRHKFRLMRVLIIAAFALLVLQLGQIQIVNGDYYRNAANQNRFRLIQTDALRGIVYDRTGKILVRNIPSFNVSIIPADLPDDPTQIYQRLASLLNMPIDTIIENTVADPIGSVPSEMERIVTPPKRKPGISELVAKAQRDPFAPVLIQTNVPRQAAFYLEENHLDFPGVQVGLEPVREYVEGPLFAHILGYTGHIPRETFADYQAQGYASTDQVGLTGVEQTFENDLRGIKGRRYIEVDVAGREVANLGEEAPTPGNNVVLALDADFQKTVETILAKALKTSKAKQAVAIALDPRNGQILAMVSLPSYDNNLFSTGISVDDYTNLAQDPLHPLMDQAISGQYPPGSTFKLIPASAALQEHVLDINTRLQTPGILWVPNKYYPDNERLAQPFYDWYKPGFGSLTIRDALAVSSDVFFYQVAGGESPSFDTGLGEERLAGYARMFGLGELTGVDLPGEAKGLVPDPAWKRKTIGDIWTVGDTYNMGIGQGYVLATPLQVADYTAIVANGGTLYKPQIVNSIVDANGKVVRQIQPQVIRHVAVDPKDFAIVREGMRNSVTRGTSSAVNLADVNVAAKTGTAEYYGPKVNGHLPTHAWFTSFAPYDNPQIVVSVFVYGGGEGSAVAAPAAADILRAYFRLDANSPLVANTQPIAPSVVVKPSAPSGGTGPAPAPAHKYTGRVLGVDNWHEEQPGIYGTVVDATGHGVPNIRVAVDKCDGNAIFNATSDANGAFSFNGMYWHDTLHWCVRTTAPSDSDTLTVDVAPYKRYTVQFVPTQ